MTCHPTEKQGTMRHYNGILTDKFSIFKQMVKYDHVTSQPLEIWRHSQLGLTQLEAKDCADGS